MSDYTYRLCSKEVDRYFTISYGNFNYKFNSEIYNMCIPELFQNRIIHLHSSYIIYHDKAILFTGPSGIGKTTQAELWRDYQGAEIINGDVTLIRKWDGRYCAFGAPIHGSSPYCENKSAPIEALIVLQQGTENQIEVLNHFEALSACRKYTVRKCQRKHRIYCGRPLTIFSLRCLYTVLPVVQTGNRQTLSKNFLDYHDMQAFYETNSYTQ